MSRVVCWTGVLATIAALSCQKATGKAAGDVANADRTASDEPPRSDGSDSRRAASGGQNAGSGVAGFAVVPATSVVARDNDCGDVAVYFAKESSALSKTGKEALDQLAACLSGRKEQTELSVTGTADPRGTEAYNQRLSRERARSVVEYLESKGVEGDRFEVYARGEEGTTEGMPRLWPEQRRALVGEE